MKPVAPRAAVTTLAALCLAACTASPALTGAPTPAPSAMSASAVPRVEQVALASPALGDPWQLLLGAEEFDDAGARIIDLDWEAPAADVARLNDAGAYTVCYLSVGTVEDYRPDAASFPAELVGNTLGDWPDERYLDIRALDVLGPLWAARLDECARKGFDAVDPDNIDVYSNDSGFALNEDDSVAMMIWLADAAHSRGMAIGQKNAPELTGRLVDHLDFAVTEQCLTQGWCDEVSAYVMAGKPNLAVEYVEDGATLAALCAPAREQGISLLVSTLDLAENGARCPG